MPKGGFRTTSGAIINYTKITFDCFGCIRIKKRGKGLLDLSGLIIPALNEKKFVGHGDEIDVPLEYSLRLSRSFHPNVEGVRYLGNFILTIPMSYIMSASVDMCIEAKLHVPSVITFNFQPYHEQNTFYVGEHLYQATSLQNKKYGIKCTTDDNSETTEYFHADWKKILAYAFDACRTQIGRIPTYLGMRGLGLAYHEPLVWNSNLYCLLPIQNEKDVFLVYSPYEKFVSETLVMLPSLYQSIFKDCVERFSRAGIDVIKI